MADEEEIQGDTGEFVTDTGTSVKYPVRYGNIQGTSREIRKVSRRYSTVERTRRRYRGIREKDNRDLWQTQGDPGRFSWIQRDLGRYPNCGDTRGDTRRSRKDTGKFRSEYREIHVIPGSLRGIQDIQKRYREMRNERSRGNTRTSEEDTE
jgi:hypothetical protein